MGFINQLIEQRRNHIFCKENRFIRDMDVQGWVSLFLQRKPKSRKEKEKYNIDFADFWRCEVERRDTRTLSSEYDDWYEGFYQQMQICWHWSDIINTWEFSSPVEDCSDSEYFYSLLGEFYSDL